MQNKHSKLSVSSMNIIDDVTGAPVPSHLPPTSADREDSMVSPAPAASHSAKHEKPKKNKDKEDESVAATSSGGDDPDQ